MIHIKQVFISQPRQALKKSPECDSRFQVAGGANGIPVFAAQIFLFLLVIVFSAQAQPQYNAPPPPPNQSQPQYNAPPPPSNQSQPQYNQPQYNQPQYNPPPPPPAYNQEAEQPQAAPPPPLPANQLDQLVARIALYPDPLLAHVLTASTFPDQVPEAANWADQHSDLKGEALANAIQEDNLPWDPSVLALLPFPSVLDTMARDPNWTQQLGDAVLADRSDVMDAVQRMRKQARDYGYLQSNPYDRVVDSGGYVEILPTNPAYIYVPTYDPFLVYARPRPGFFVGGAIHFGPAIVLGGAFAPWGWTRPAFEWRTHNIFFDRTPWNRSWENRRYYVHPYARAWAPRPGPRIERHEVRRRERR